MESFRGNESSGFRRLGLGFRAPLAQLHVHAAVEMMPEVQGRHKSGQHRPLES